MKKSFLPFILFCAFLLLVILQAFCPSPFPDGKAQQILDKADIYNAKFPQEKIYLHTDRSSYWANDDIWFKAYLKDSPIPDCNLYVELLNSSGTILQKKLLWAQNGLAYGDLHPADSLSSGVYQIRAYTNWMRNFGDDWFYRKDLVIMNLRDKQLPAEISRTRADEIDFQFFPEGGTFLSGVGNRIAFKATDQHGKGLDFTGKITDDQGNEVAWVKSQLHGMGNFKLIPEKGKKYTAEVTFGDGEKKKIKLPAPEESGFHLAIDGSDPARFRIQVTEHQNEAPTNPDEEFLLVAQANGVVALQEKFRLKEGSCPLEISKDSLPQGIIQFTLFDAVMIPRCERLVFVNHHDFVKVEIKPDKENYLPREKVEVQFNAFPKSGTPVPANLSLSVFNKESQMETANYPGNILTWFLLNSELKGMIEDPGWYFKDDSLSTRLALDNLMLTHGYRHFEWKAISENQFPKIDYPAEQNLQVKGRVTTILASKPVPNCQLTLMLVKTQYGLYMGKTDTLGRFMFPNLYFYNDVFFTVQAINQKGKKNTAIDLDQKSSVSPDPGRLPVSYEYIQEHPVNTMKVLIDENKEFLSKKWRLSDTILLSNVNVVAYKKKKGDGNFRMYTDADHVYDASKHDQVYSNIIENLENDAYMIRYVNAPFYLDGVPVDREFIASLPASIIDKVEVVKIGAFMSGGGPGVFFYLKRGEHQQLDRKDAIGMKSGRIMGYSMSRKFYSPAYETPAAEENKKDFRSTIYWNPILRIDSTGVANASFYNSDLTGEVEVVVEGVAADGKLCRGVGRYTVKN